MRRSAKEKVAKKEDLISIFKPYFRILTCWDHCPVAVGLGED
jgi:hypothetical protein